MGKEIEMEDNLEQSMAGAREKEKETLDSREK